MLVELRGLRGGSAHAPRWELTAPMLHGPGVPCFAAVLLLRRFPRGEALLTGAHTCVGLISLAEFEA